MLPAKIQRKLASVRQLEFSIRMVWGIARWIAIVLLVLGVACLVDWLIDRYYSTPYILRVALFASQLILFLALPVVFLAWQGTRGLGDNDLALQVEEYHPPFKHRLISVVQFHKEGAKTSGMSQELILQVTKETDEQSSEVNFSGVVRKDRIPKSIGVVLPLVLLGGLFFYLWPDTMKALVARQFLANAEIPRSVYIELDPSLPTVLPKGEEVELRVLVSGPGWSEDMNGQIRLDPKGAPSQYYPLEFKKRLKSGKAVYAVFLGEQYTDFGYRAWISDGRLEEPGSLKFVPRPVIQDIYAWMRLPRSIAETPSGKQYEQLQEHGKIVALAGSDARIKVKIQKPIKKAWLHLRGQVQPQQNPYVVAGTIGLSCENGWQPVSAFSAHKKLFSELAGTPYLGYEAALQIKEMKVSTGDENYAEAILQNLPENATGYRIIVEDKYGFRNISAPHRSIRGIRIIPEEVPNVAFLPEQFPPLGKMVLGSEAAAYEVEGLPIPPGGPIRMAYTATGRYGIGAARLRFRVFKKPAQGSEMVQDPKWQMLPLKEYVSDEDEVGAFLPYVGAFAKSPIDAQIEFYAQPPEDPEKHWGRNIAGGRFDFLTRNIPDGNGGFYTPQPGDEIEYYIEVFADSDMSADRPSARTEVRIKTVVTGTEVVRWMRDALQEYQRIQQLETKQAEVIPINN